MRALDLVRAAAQRAVHDRERHERQASGFMAVSKRYPVLPVRGIS